MFTMVNKWGWPIGSDHRGKADIVRRIEELAQEVAEREGCFLYDVEFKGRELKVFVDREEKGVSINDCANVSRGLSLLLDVEDLIHGGRYNLEVSSPGLERPLKKPWHFEKAQGQKISVKLKNALSGGTDLRKKFAGKLLRQVGDIIELEFDGEVLTIGLENIEKAQILFDFDK